MPEKILRWFPEIDEITDRDLRDKVIAVVREAIELGGWSERQVEQVPFTLLIKGTPVTLIEHTRVVTQIAMATARIMREAYGDRLKVNLNFVIAGGILHDVGKLLEFTEESGQFVKSKQGKILRHPFSGMALAFKHGVPDEVCHMIACHSHEGDGTQRTVEGVIINHADFVSFETLGGKV